MQQQTRPGDVLPHSSAQHAAAQRIVNGFDVNTITSNHLTPLPNKGSSKTLMGLLNKNESSALESLVVLKGELVESENVDIQYVTETFVRDIHELHTANYFYKECSEGLTDARVKERIKGIETGWLLSIVYNKEKTSARRSTSVVPQLVHFYIDSGFDKTPKLGKTAFRVEMEEDHNNLREKLPEGWMNGAYKFTTHFIMTGLVPISNESVQSIDFSTCKTMLRAAHDQGVVHCDSKTDNMCCVLVDGVRHAVPIDWGFARRTDMVLQTDGREVPGLELRLRFDELDDGRSICGRLGTLYLFDMQTKINNAYTDYYEHNRLTQKSRQNFDELPYETRIELAKVYDMVCFYFVCYVHTVDSRWARWFYTNEEVWQPTNDTDMILLQNQRWQSLETTVLRIEYGYNLEDAIAEALGLKERSPPQPEQQVARA